MRRCPWVLVLVAVLGCGRDGGVHVVPAAELPADVYAPARPQRSPVAPRETVVWFVRAARLEAVRRVELGAGRDAEVAMRHLLAGPHSDEQAAGLTTAVPGGTKLLGVDVDTDVVSVNLSSEFELVDAQEVLLARLAQVVYTLTELQRVARVRFLIDSEPVGVVDESGALVRRPVGRTDYASLGPQAAVSSPVTPEPAPPAGGAAPKPRTSGAA